MKDVNNKKPFLIGCGVGIIIAVILAVVLCIIFIPKSKNVSGDVQINSSASVETKNQNKDNNDQITKESTTKQVVENIATIDFEKTNEWNSGERFNKQFNMKLNNISAYDISDWKVVLKTSTDITIDQKWNCNATVEGDVKSQSLVITPVDYNKEIKKGESKGDVGFIVSFGKNCEFESYNMVITTRDNKVYTIDSNGLKGNPDASTKETSDSTDNSGAAQDNTQSPTTSQGDSSGNTGDSDDSAGDSEKPDNSSDDNIPDNSGDLPDKATGAGQLHVSGTSLCDESGNKVVLRGVSTHGMAWFPDYVNYDAFKTLRDDWGANVVRLAMYTAEYGGYCNGGDRAHLKQLIDDGVSYATQLGLYVIIDWHILSDGNPNTYKSDAISFFDEMSAKYAGHTNVLYEICNEPQNSDWNSVIKPYAQEVISTIRSNDSDAVIIVGTNTWSQDVDAVVGNKIDDDNVMYALHFYASTHTDWIRNKLKTALDGGVPVFVSECSITDASGNGSIDYSSANEWLNLLNERGVSFIAWSLCNKNESSALISPGCNKLSGWTESDLSETGKWFRTAIKGK